VDNFYAALLGIYY